MARHASKYRLIQRYPGIWQVSCPGADWGLCSGHTFNSRREARAWIAKEEENK